MDKLKEVDWRGLYRSATSKVKQYALNLTPLEVKVEEATNAETWGPHGTVMNEIADAAEDWDSYRQIMGVIARRLQEKDENWRMCYKALLLLEHLIKHGPAKIVPDVQSSANVLERLTTFEYKDANGRDHGQNVRHRAKEILALINSPDRVQQERDKAKANRQKYRGVSATEMRMGGIGSSSSSTMGSGGGGFGSSMGGGLGGSLGVSSISSSFRSGGGGGGGNYGSLRGSGSFGRDRLSSGGGDGNRSSLVSSSSRDEGGFHDFPARRSATDSGSVLHTDGDGGASGGGSSSSAAQNEDAVAATRARIERLRLSERAAAEEKAAEETKKKLHDVKVNPKIAASLGLKIAAPTAPKPAPAAAPASAATGAAASGAKPPPAPEMDLLGGLDEPTHAPAAAAAAAGGSTGAWDAFGGSLSSSGHAAAAAAPQPAIDLLGSLGSPTPQAALAAAAPARAQPSASVDPFAALAPPAPQAPAFAHPQHTAMSAFAKPTSPNFTRAVAAAGVPSALPESMFSELTGIAKPQQPMGQPSGLGSRQASAASPPTFGLSPAPPAPAYMATPPLADDFSAFNSAASIPSAAAAAPLGAGLGSAASGSLGQGRSSHASTSSVDFGSFSYAPAGTAAGTAPAAKDPFDDLFKL